MYRKILYPTAFEEFYLDILACILNFRKVGTEEIVLVHVIHSAKLPILQEGISFKLEEDLRAFLDAKMDDAVGIIEGAGMKATKRIETGEPHLEILRVAKEENVSLIVSGRERKGYLGEIFVGSITDKVIRYGAIPVYIPKYPGVMGADRKTCERFSQRLFTKILYPTDWSECAKAALRYLKGMKEAGVEEVVIAHIMDEKAMKLQSPE